MDNDPEEKRFKGLLFVFLFQHAKIKIQIYSKSKTDLIFPLWYRFLGVTQIRKQRQNLQQLKRILS